MQTFKKLLALLLSVAMLAGIAALAEEAALPETAPAVAELKDDEVVAGFYGTPVTWGEVKETYDALVNEYGAYNDMTDKANIDLFRAIALQNKLVERMLEYKGKELGLDQLTDEELAAADEKANSAWDNAVQDHVAYFHSDLTDESGEEERAAAVAEAEQYWHDLGFNVEALREDYRKYAVYDKVEALITQDAVVTDEDVEAAYQALVEADKALYENDIAAYIEYNNYVDSMAYYAMMYGTANEMDKAWYKPAGFRAVKHILLPVDETLMNTYNDLSARFEEQQHDEEIGETANETPLPTPEPAVEEQANAAEPSVEETPIPTPEPVTEEQVNAAKAAILESLAEKIDEINQKIADGADFDALIAEYAVDADGNPTDPGSLSEPYKTTGYEVASGSVNFVAPFVEAAFSVDNVGDVSAPYISDYGVHIVKYVSDVPAGPIEMTEAQRLAKRESLLQTKRTELYSATMEKWMAEADIVYTGIISTPQELLAAAAAEEETEVMPEEQAEEIMAEDAAAE